MSELRQEFVTEAGLQAAAETFVAAIGWGNAEYLRANLRLTMRQSDALRALDYALTADFNFTRQEQIRRSQRLSA